MAENKEHILAVRDLDITFKTTAGPVHAIRGVNIDLYRGETVALVGESEMAEGRVALKDMNSGEQSSLTIDEVISRLTSR